MVNFAEIISRVTIRDILAEAGYYPDRNRMPCPIHDGNNPTSFSFTDDTYCCFSCGASGGLLDLTKALLGVDRKQALKYLAEKAGIQFEDYPSDGKQRLYLPSRSRPIRVLDAELVGLQVDLEGLEILRDHFTWRIRYARKCLKNGTFDLARYYAITQYAEYVLEELDAKVSKTRYEINMIKRGLSNAKYIGRK